MLILGLIPLTGYENMRVAPFHHSAVLMCVPYQADKKRTKLLLKPLVFIAVG